MPPFGKWPLPVKLWLLASLAVILLNMLTAHKAYGQVPVRINDSISSPALTRCDSAGQPEILIKSGMDGVTVRTLINHEMVHLRQIDKYEGGCKALAARYEIDWRFRLEIEIEAYSLQFIPVLTADDHEAFLDALTSFMWGHYIRDSGLASYAEMRDFIRNGKRVAAIPP